MTISINKDGIRNVKKVEKSKERGKNEEEITKR